MPDVRISVIRVHDLLLVTMPPDPDDPTVTTLQEQVLRAVARYNALGVVLDICAVDTVDSFFARAVSEITQMVGLMGGRTVIAGMRPSVAIAVTQLGVTLGTTMTALDVDRALDMLNDARPGR